MKSDVFISHSSKDEKIANEICNSFESNGIKCWIAPRDIAPGSDWAESINNAIKNSSVMVLVFSENSNNSTQVAKELNLAISNNLVILPFKIDQSSPTGSMEYYLSDTHWLQASGDNIGTEIVSLQKVVSLALSHKEPEVKEMNRELNIASNKKRFSKKIIAIFVAVIAIIVGIISLFFFNSNNSTWDCFVEKYSTEDNMIVGGEEAVKKKRLVEIDDSFGLVHEVEIISDEIKAELPLDSDEEYKVTIKTPIKPSVISYHCGNNGPTGWYSDEDISYQDGISTIFVPAQPRTSDGYDSGERYRVRIVVKYNEKISGDYSEVENFYFDKNVKVK